MALYRSPLATPLVHSRRRFLALTAAAAALLSGRNARAAPIREAADRPAGDFAEITLSLTDSRGNRRRTVVYLRDPASTRERQGLVLLHGFGQAASEQRALAAWRMDYGLLGSYAWLADPPLVAPHRARFMTEERVAEINAELSGRAVGEFVFICPVTPVPYYKGRREALDRFADFIEETLLPEVRRLAPIGRIGLAGVSMGGRVGLEVLVRKPALFPTFSGVLTAIEDADVARYADRIEAALERGHPLALHVLSAASDIYRGANERLLRELRARRLEAHYACPCGTHTDAWMREVGCAEMLLWQDRALATARSGPTQQP